MLALGEGSPYWALVSTDNGTHPEWPGYTARGTDLDFKLETQAYHSRTLIDNTVLSFYSTLGDRNLTPTQISARTELTSLYKESQKRTKPIRTRKMRKFMSLVDQYRVSHPETDEDAVVSHVTLEHAYSTAKFP
ncbi:hypothetical protein GGS21DRAFT_487365 [Xylaria nigripes]|nr:hypothetical protein GGS21DRAFT_487365 [Xylaria nigripes]